MGLVKEREMSYWREILDKKPWLFEYYYPSTGSRYTVLLTMYQDGTNKKIITDK